MSNLVEVPTQVNGAHNSSYGPVYGVPKVPVSTAPTQTADPKFLVPIQNQATPVAQQGRGGLKEFKTNLRVKFEGPLNNFVGKMIATKKVTKSENVFKSSPSQNFHSLVMPGQKPEGKLDISKAIITSHTVTGGNNDFPFEVDFNWDGLGDMAPCVDTDGRQVAFSMHSGESQRGYTNVIYDSKNSATDPLVAKYAPLNITEIKASIKDVGESSCHLPIDSELTKFILANERRYGNGALSSADQQIVEGKQYYVVPRNLIQSALSDLHNLVLSKFNFVNLDDFKICMFRRDGKELGSLEGSKFEHLDAADKAEIMKKNFSCSFDLELTWKCPISVSGTNAVPVLAPASAKVPLGNI